MTQSEILNKLEEEFAEMEKTASSFTEDQFFQSPVPGKWSAAQNLEHLFMSTKPLAGLFGTPEIMVEKWGKSNKPSRSYDEVVELYLQKVGNVGAGIPAFTPQETELTKGEQIIKFDMVNEKFLDRAGKLSETDLDTYQAPHPLIGLLTVREFLYFTL
ncbi:MAG TPA: DinB family protein, partial [Bacteroidia bacterium]|nr:DinB family protein [Bacteroidia bacterium]